MNEGMTWLQSQLVWERQLDRLRHAEQVRVAKAAQANTTLAMAQSAPHVTPAPPSTTEAA